MLNYYRCAADEERLRTYPTSMFLPAQGQSSKTAGIRLNEGIAYTGEILSTKAAVMLPSFASGGIGLRTRRTQTLPICRNNEGRSPASLPPLPALG